MSVLNNVVIIISIIISMLIMEIMIINNFLHTNKNYVRNIDNNRLNN